MWNSSILPIYYEIFADKSLSNITFRENDIGKIISSLDSNKAHGHDMMSIHVLKISRDSIYKSLGLIYNNMFSFFIENDLISQNQSGFKQGGSCINQLL